MSIDVTPRIRNVDVLWDIFGVERTLKYVCALANASSSASSALRSYLIRRKNSKQIESFDAIVAFIKEFLNGEHIDGAHIVKTNGSGNKYYVSMTKVQYDDLLVLVNTPEEPVEGGEEPEEPLLPPLEWEIETIGNKVWVGFPTSEDANTYKPSGASVVAFDNTANWRILNASGSEVTTLHDPQNWKMLTGYEQANNTGCFILAGTKTYSGSNPITSTASLIQSAVTQSASGEVTLGSNPTSAERAYANFVSLLVKLRSGYSKSDMPYMKMKSFGRFYSIVDSSGRNIVGAKYNYLLYAFAVAMHICDYCNTSEWIAFKNSV